MSILPVAVVSCGCCIDDDRVERLTIETELQACYALGKHLLCAHYGLKPLNELILKV
jgi:hypothetical protein